MNNAAKSSNPTVTRATPTPPRSKKRLLRAFLLALLLTALAVTGYSIYVANFEPDSQETVILGQSQIAAGSPAGLRVLVRNHLSGRPVANAAVDLSLTSKSSKPISLGSFHTDTTGTLPDSLTIPDMTPGEYELNVNVVSPLGHDHVTKTVQVQSPLRLLLATDKPRYQPGQTIHLRSLALNARTQKPAAKEPVTFEVSDAKGNKIFKETHPASAFGIASADFVLATELNMGRFEIQARAGASASERTVEVTNYVLPKFRIGITTDKSYYLPGQTVSGTVQADYFFGKPVAQGALDLKVQTFEATPVVITDLSGRTDNAGRYAFTFSLPNSMVGLPQMGQQGLVDLAVVVVDSAQHPECKTMSLPVAENDLVLTALPEAGTWVPGVENLVYVLAAYPDGQPATCRVAVNGSDYQSDAQGLCTLKVTPARADQQLHIDAADAAGRHAALTWQPENSKDGPPLLLRLDKAVYSAGQTAQITLLSPEPDNTIFIDVIKDGQTILTQSLPLANHRATYALNLPVNLVGALKINAYMITSSGEDRGCSRLIYVNPGSALHIAARASQAVYRPGETAKLDFTVTDATGHPAPGALGISVVDESVFAMGEDRPGLLPQFLAAAGELLKPRYQIKSLGDPDSLFVSGNQNQALAQAWFASCGASAAGGESPDSLVRNGLIPQNLLDHALSLRGTSDYEALRNDPQFAAIIRQIEGGQGVYNLRETTGPIKASAAEAWRTRYFNRLWHILGLCFVTGLILLPFGLIICSFRRGAGIDPKLLSEPGIGEYLGIAGTLYRVVAALVLFPMLLYPLGFILADRWSGENPAWRLFSIEVVVTVTVVLLQFRALANAQTGILKNEMPPLRRYLAGFLAQAVLSRGAVVLFALTPSHGFGDGFLPPWFLGSLVAPLIVLAALSDHIKRQLAAKGITARIQGVRALEILIIMACLMILGSMLLPALAAAKRKAQKITLVNDLKQIEMANQMATDDSATPAGNSPAPRLRHDFPETLFWQPELITDDTGHASVEIPLADSITTWRGSVDAVNAAGKIGAAEIPVAVFQEFFVDLDLPESLSLNDEVSIPVNCYNYLKTAQEIRLNLAAAPWFACATPDLAVQLEPGAVKSVSFSIKVLEVGRHTLRVEARGLSVGDAVEREIQVKPVGAPIADTRNDTLRGTFATTMNLPATAIPGSASLGVKFYPSRFSEIVEGLESIFQAPYGCFEQTSATTYPNVLVLEYLQRSGRLTPEIENPARKYINAGYQRLLTFEVAGGGFEWFGRDPANICLTAYGILEFTDMARVHPVDEAVTKRARNWLFSQQNSNGSWEEKNRGWTWSGRGSITAFAAWALAESGDQSANLNRALDYLQAHPDQIATTYARALAAIAFLDRNRNDAFGRDLARQLQSAAIVDNQEMVHWTSDGFSVTYSHEDGMETECTALCTMALMKAGEWPQSVKQGLTWISRHKFADGTLGSTQATILAMRALLQGTDTPLGQNFDSAITVALNGRKMETFHINHDNSDVMKQIDLTSFLRVGTNQIEFRQTPAGELPFQVASSYWLPATPAPAPARVPDALAIGVQYDRTTLAVDDLLKANVSVKNTTGLRINMAIVDLGIPPGFDIDTTTFDTLQENGKIEKFEVTGSQIILYLRELPAASLFQFEYSLRAKYPLRVQTPPTTVYEYYQPQNRSQSAPATLQVVRR